MGSLLKGKHILVTGASSGMGRVFARMISDEGAILSLTARDDNRLTETMESLSGDGHDKIICDLTDDGQLKTLVSCLDPIDGAVFCAGINHYMPAKFLKQDVVEEMFKVNFYSSIFLTQLLLRKKLINKGASLVYIASLSANLGVPGTLSYASSKAALISAVKVLASELAPLGIRVNAISPGIVRTEMLSGTNIEEEAFEEQAKNYPLGLGTPEDVGNAVLFHLCDGSRWLTGNNLVIDGGYSLK